MKINKGHWGEIVLLARTLNVVTGMAIKYEEYRDAQFRISRELSNMILSLNKELRAAADRIDKHLKKEIK